MIVVLAKLNELGKTLRATRELRLPMLAAPPELKKEIAQVTKLSVPGPMLGEMRSLRRLILRATEL